MKKRKIVVSIIIAACTMFCFGGYTENNEVKDNTAIDFSRFAPNAPEEVKQAFIEAAEETGYNEGERMDYLSQVFIHQVENRQNGVAGYTDVFGGSITSALQAAREILYDLENVSNCCYIKNIKTSG